MANSKISALTSATTPLAGTETLPVVQSGVTKQVSVANLTAGRVVDTAGLTITDYAGATAAINISGAGTIPARIRVVSTTSAGANIVLRDSGTTNNVTLLSSGQDLVIQTGGVQRVNVSGGGDLTMLTGNVIQGTAAKGINFTANTATAGSTSRLLNWYEEGTWTPNAVATTGTITTYTSSGRYTRVGRLVTLQIEINITTNGTGAGTIKVDNLPFTVGSVNAAGVGKEVANTGKAISGSFNASSTNSYWNYYDGTYPGASGNVIWITGSYSV